MTDMRRIGAMLRIAIVGVAGSGKSTLGEKLGAALELPCYDLDALYHLPGWQAPPVEEFRARIRTITETDKWIIVGNYSRVRVLVWGHADTLVWLDYPLPFVLSRLIRRSLKRVITHENLWGNGVYEGWGVLFSRDREDNLLRWAIHKHPIHKQEYPAALTQSEYAHLHLKRFTSARHTVRWLAALQASRKKDTSPGNALPGADAPDEKITSPGADAPPSP